MTVSLTGLNKTNFHDQSLYTSAIFPLCTHAIMLSRSAVMVIMNTYKPFVDNKGGIHTIHTTLQHMRSNIKIYCNHTLHSKSYHHQKPISHTYYSPFSENTEYNNKSLM